MSTSFHKRTDIIIGAGLGGLICGALLAKEGHQVTLLEKNKTPGGGLACFSRFGINFPTGMHFVGSFHPGSQMDKLCNYLGIRDKLHFVDINKDCFDKVICLNPNFQFRFPKGRKAYTDYICKIYPYCVDEIHNYIDTLYHLVDEIDLYNLRPDTIMPLSHGEELFMPANLLLERYISDPELRTLLTYLTPLYAGEKNKTPAYIHALISISLIEGAMQFSNGSKHFADALVSIIESNGGNVICNEKVTSLSVNDHCISHIITNNGNTYSADSYISDIPITELVDIVPNGSFPNSFCKRITELPHTYSAFKTFINLKKSTIPFSNSFTFCSKGKESAWDPFEGGEDAWPQSMLIIAHPDSNNQYTKAITLISPMPFDWVRKWERTVTKERGENYLEWKRHKAELHIDFLKKIEPRVYYNISDIETSSPLTIRDYLGNKEGALYGLSIDSNNLLKSHLSVRTKLANLFLTGQDINIHGMCGVCMSAIMTAETILNDINLRNRIKNS